MNRPRWTKVTREEAEEAYAVNETAWEIFETVSRDNVIDLNEQRMLRAAISDSRQATFRTRKYARIADLFDAASVALKRCGDPRHMLGIMNGLIEAVDAPETPEAA